MCLFVFEILSIFILGTSQIIIRCPLLALYIWLINLTKPVYHQHRPPASPQHAWELSTLTAKEEVVQGKLEEPYVICFNLYIVHLYMCEIYIYKLL